MKIALVHDYIKEYGGAERVLEALHEVWPDAPIFTTVYLPDFLGPHKKRFANWNIKTSWLQYVPFKEKLISPFRIIVPFMFRSFDFSKFDIVIVSATGAYIPNTIICHPERKRRISLQSSGDSSVVSLPQNDKKKRPIHICYCHTPPRYLYGYATAREWKKNLIYRVIGEIGNHFLRLVDFKSAQNVNYFIANSKNVAGRIKKFYRREAEVIYPPVEISRSVIASGAKQSQTDGIALSSFGKLRTLRNDNEIKRRQYFLAGGRLARPKHIDLIVRACRELKVPLKVFGKGFGGWENELKSQISNLKSTSQNSKIEFVGEVSDEEKMELMRNAKAYIFAAEDEDFGITPVEAMSVGTPVIAFASGGVLESVIDSKTGVLYRFNDSNHLSEAIHKFEKTKFDRELIVKHAQKFSKERFKKEIKEFVEQKLI